jgi:hypothetical protein
MFDVCDFDFDWRDFDPKGEVKKAKNRRFTCVRSLFKRVKESRYSNSKPQFTRQTEVFDIFDKRKKVGVQFLRAFISSFLRKLSHSESQRFRL